MRTGKRWDYVKQQLPVSQSCMPAVALPKKSAYGLAVTVGHRRFCVGGGNGIDWFSSMLRLAFNEEDAETGEYSVQWHSV